MWSLSMLLFVVSLVLLVATKSAEDVLAFITVHGGEVSDPIVIVLLLVLV